jgi:hypothetical protein
MSMLEFVLLRVLPAPMARSPLRARSAAVVPIPAAQLPAAARGHA